MASDGASSIGCNRREADFAESARCVDLLDKNTSVKTDCKQEWHKEVSNANNSRKLKSTFGGMKQGCVTDCECSAAQPCTRGTACTPGHLREKSTEVISDSSESSTLDIDEQIYPVVAQTIACLTLVFMFFVSFWK